jgi:hypothetical protein
MKRCFFVVLICACSGFSVENEVRDSGSEVVGSKSIIIDSGFDASVKEIETTEAGIQRKEYENKLTEKEVSIIIKDGGNNSVIVDHNEMINVADSVILPSDVFVVDIRARGTTIESNDTLTSITEISDTFIILNDSGIVDSGIKDVKNDVDYCKQARETCITMSSVCDAARLAYADLCPDF